MNFYIPNRQMLVRYARELRNERFTPGIDNVKAADNYNYFLLNADSVIGELEKGAYRPKPALSFSVVQRGGKERDLCRFCAVDSVIQKALAEILSTNLEEIFSPFSFAYRPGRGLHAAVAQYVEYAARYKFSVKIDPVACFDSIDRKVLLGKLKKIVDNDAFFAAVKSYAETPTADEKGVHPRELGILQGSPLSPALCNLYFNDMDSMLERKKIPFCRYADDLVIFADSRKVAERNSNMIIGYLSDSLKLTLNSQKFRICSPTDLEYLGYTFRRNENGTVIACERERRGASVYSSDWVGSEQLRLSHSTNILSEGILTKKEAAVVFESDGRKVPLPLGAIEQINIYSSVTITPQVLKTLFEHNVCVNIFDRYGYLVGDFQPARGFKSIGTPLAQLKIYQRSKGMRADYARDFLLSQIHHLRLNLSYYYKQYKGKKCAKAIEFIDSKRKEIKKLKNVDDMLIAEAQVRERYFSCFNELIRTEDFKFKKCTRRPPKDEINALLSFAYTFLYNYIAVEINKTSLDIRIAFLHSATSRNQSLNLDIADVFKPLIADRTVLTLINKRTLRKEHFVREKGGAVYLSDEGKRILLTALYEKLDSKITYKKKSISYCDVIQDEVRRLCADTRQLKKHKSFRQVR